MKTALALATILAVLSFPDTAVAHSKTNTTTPANEAVLAEPPANIEMTFDKGMRLTRVVLSAPGAGPTDLDLSAVSGFVTEASVPMNGSGAGEYLIEWRGLSIDGHAMQDEIRFTVTGE